ncbi:hypothetical protein BH10ACT3_BH10ACT3_15240 [soil metagenome]
MLRHVVLLKFVDGTPPEQIDGIVASLQQLPSHLPSLVRYEVGRNVGLTDGAADLAIVAEFDDADGYVLYRDDPTHQAIIQADIAPFLAERLGTQVEI